MNTVNLIYTNDSYMDEFISNEIGLSESIIPHVIFDIRHYVRVSSWGI